MRCSNTLCSLLNLTLRGGVLPSICTIGMYKVETPIFGSSSTERPPFSAFQVLAAISPFSFCQLLVLEDTTFLDIRVLKDPTFLDILEY